MGALRRMYTCSPRLITLAFIILPVLMSAMKLENNDFKTVDITDYGGEVFISDPDPAGQPSYRILNKIDGSVYIGGNESLVRVYLDGNQQLQTTTVKLVTTNATNQLALSCSVLNSANNETVCWNFIRVVELLTRTPNQLLVCGTNAYDRLCYRCNTADLSNITCTPGLTPRLNLVPKLPNIRPSSAVFGPEGTDSTGDLLFAALAGDNDDPTLQKYIVPSIGDPRFELDTITVGGRFIQKGVVFVGRPFEYTDPSSGHTYVFSFFREPAKEYETHGNKVYSRLSRVCKNDTGDISRSNKLATFIKARVNCSLPNLLLPFHYDLIQDVIWRNETKEVYAIFTSQELGPAASALCRYRMSDIMKLFDEGKFKEQAGLDPNRLWLPVDTDPVPRPGTCENVHSTSYPPLLDKLVPNYNPVNPSQLVGLALLNTSAIPTLYVDGIRFTSLAADFQGDKCIFFFGTTNGSVLKAYKDNCLESTEKFKAVEFIVMEANMVINGLELVGGANANKVLIVSGANELLKWPLGNCSSARVESECVTVFGPYCTVTDGMCGESGGDSTTIDFVLVQPQQSSITAGGVEKVVLYCEAEYGVFNTESFTVNWTKTGNSDFIENNNHLVRLRQLSPSLLEMEVTVIKGTSDGSYNCSSSLGTSVYTKIVTIKHTDCLTEQSLEERCNLHSKLEVESQNIKMAFEKEATCSIDVKTCDTCPYGSTP